LGKASKRAQMPRERSACFLQFIVWDRKWNCLWHCCIEQFVDIPFCSRVWTMSKY
jgi:hypothetical protein